MIKKKKVYKAHKDYVVDSRGCKIYKDIKRHYLLMIDSPKGQIYYVYSVGISGDGTPFVTIGINLEVQCVRLPKDMLSWAQCMLSMQSKNKVQIFPHNVKFGKTNGGEHYAEFVK